MVRTPAIYRRRRSNLSWGRIDVRNLTGAGRTRPKTAAGCEVFHTQNREPVATTQTSRHEILARGCPHFSELPLSGYANFVRDKPGKLERGRTVPDRSPSERFPDLSTARSAARRAMSFLLPARRYERLRHSVGVWSWVARGILAQSCYVRHACHRMILALERRSCTWTEKKDASRA